MNRPASTVIVLGLMLAGCFKGDGAHETEPDPRREKNRVREVARWAGVYRFEDCASASAAAEPTACSKFAFTITKDGDSWIVVEREGKQTRIHARPRVEGPAGEKLRLVFREYEGEDESKVGLRAFDPLRGRFTTGDPLATLERELSGRICLDLEKLESKQGKRDKPRVCQTESAPTDDRAPTDGRAPGTKSPPPKK